jgi:acyl-CoA thioester hydrolase
MHRYEIRVRYGDTDQMGFAYYGHYLRWFEIGRAEMLRSLGRSYRQVEQEDGVSLPVLVAHCRYLKPARYDARVTIETGVALLGRASVRFAYRIVNAEDGTLHAHGWTEHCFMGAGDRPVRPPAPLRALLEAAPLATSPPA